MGSVERVFPIKRYKSPEWGQQRDFAMCRILSRHEEATKGLVVSLTAEWRILPSSFDR